MKSVIFICLAALMLLVLVPGAQAAEPEVQYSGWVQWAVSDGGNGHYYRVGYTTASAGISWEAAKALSSDSVWLATMNLTSENQWVYDNLVSKDTSYWSNGIGPWLGGLKAQGWDKVGSNDGVWGQWVAGDPGNPDPNILDKDPNWIAGQPNNIPPTGGANYLHYWSGSMAANSMSAKWADSGYPIGSGYSNPRAFVQESAVPEPGTVVAACALLSPAALMFRRRRI